MNAFEPTAEQFEAILLEREDNVDRLALEKDYYLVLCMQVLADLVLPQDVRLVFTGGTSLSKRGLISRFSEDADFLLLDPGRALASRGDRRTLRKSINRELKRQDWCSECKERSFDNGRQMVLEIVYSSAFDAEVGGLPLRPHIRLELRVSESKFDIDRIAVRSIVAETRDEQAELYMEAAAPLTIAANKLVGLG